MTRKGAARHGKNAPAPEARTLVIVAFASLGVGLMAFVLGMHVGIDQSGLSSLSVEPGLSALGRLDRQAARLREVRARESSKLSFHETLAGPAKAPTPRMQPQPDPAVAPAAAPEAPVQDTAEPAPSTAAAGVNLGGTSGPDEQGPSQTAPEVDTPAQDSLETGTENPDSVQEAEAAQATVEKSPSAADTEPADDADADEVGDWEEGDAEEPLHYSLQVGAFPDAAPAQELVERLAGRGHVVRIVAAEVPGRGTWYRVRVGDYSDRAAADAERQRLEKLEQLFILVVPEGS